MAVLAWTDALAIGHEEMDRTHEEFVARLNALAEAEGDAMLAELDAFLRHTEAHFAQEEAWMAASEFPRAGCHRAQHLNVLEVLTEVKRRVTAGDAQHVRRLTEALAEWFADHAASMDAMLAIYLQQGADALPACSHEGSESCPNAGHHDDVAPAPAV